MIKIYDCTLREGAQASGVSFSVQDKLRITELLDDIGFTYTEGGWPGSNAKDTLFFQELKALPLKKIKVVAFGRTKRASSRAEDDASLNALVRTGIPYGHIFGKGWDLHVSEVLGISPEENLESVYESIRFLKKHMEEVSFGFEHFFDAYKENPSGAMKLIETAVQAGVDWIDLADTNGGCFPHEVASIVSTVTRSFDIAFAVHCHNDTGCGVANTIAAVQNGVKIVEGTVNGYSERCGMADLCTVIPNLQLKLGYPILEPGKLQQLTRLSQEVAELLQAEPPAFHPYVGSLAFTHKAGVHVDGFLKLKRTYEHIDPALVGNRSDIVVSEVSGKSNLNSFLRKHRLDHLFADRDLEGLVRLVKELEFGGFEFNSSEESLVLMLLRHCGKTSRRIQVNRLSVKLADEAAPDAAIGGAISALADNRADLPDWGVPIGASTIEFDGVFDFMSGRDPIVGERVQFSLTNDKASLNHLVEGFVARCSEFFPELAGTRLVDFKIRAINDRTRRVRVVLEFTDGSRTWKMGAVNSSVANATLNATIEALEYRLCMGDLGTFTQPEANPQTLGNLVSAASDSRQSAFADNGR
ncbi:citramalate synthase [Burkholderia singularis]|uniref:citramalate synthase n=1 Tax=Burkholderia singularis TaxID=1503053 RepID=UPI000A93D2F8|nr:citramalate synthase [Burkholderia singularis]